jgi:hypothetical protein
MEWFLYFFYMVFVGLKYEEFTSAAIDVMAWSCHFTYDRWGPLK